MNRIAEWLAEGVPDGWIHFKFSTVYCTVLHCTALYVRNDFVS